MGVALYRQVGKGKSRRYQKVNLGRGRRPADLTELFQGKDQQGKSEKTLRRTTTGLDSSWISRHSRACDTSTRLTASSFCAT
jgi:hypothetical protein